MKQKQYTDNSPSKEIEEDWETSGEEEMNRLHEKQTHKKSILDARDELSNLIDLLDVCTAALLGKENHGAERTQISVAHVLFFHAQTKIKELEKELAKL